MTADPIRQQAATRPDAPAVVTTSATWTWAELDARVGAAAVRLGALAPPASARPPLGRAVGVLAGTGPDLVVLFWAAWRAGVVLAPFSTRWPPAALADALDRLGLATLIADDAPALGSVRTLALADVAAPGERGHDGAAAVDRPLTVVHTSGSSGRPKAALHTVGNHVWNARGVNVHVGLTAADRWLLDLPLYHVGGLGVVVRCGLAGAALAVPDAGTPTADAVAAFRPTHVSFVATQLRRLLDATDGPTSLRAVLLGGSAMPPDLLDRAVERGLPVATSYGLTEMTSTVTATAPGAPRDVLTTSGTPLTHRDVRISQAGEVQVSGRTRFQGYVSVDGLRRPFGTDGWYATGDLARWDASGHVVVTGRADRLFVSGGENVQPEPIEAALARLDEVAEAAVVPVSDQEFGHRPVAFVRTASGQRPDPVALADALRQRLPGFMIPIAFLPWEGAGEMKPDLQALAARADRWHQTTRGAPPSGEAPRSEGSSSAGF